MKLIIDIPQDIYLLAKNIVKTSKKHNAITRAITNGKPIPKGCRLIDANKLKEDYKEIWDCDIIHPKYDIEVGEIIDSASTVIEGEKE